MKRLLTLTAALAIAATVYVIATKEAPKPMLQQLASPPTEIESVSRARVATPQVEPITSAKEANEAISEPEVSREQRAAERKHTLVAVMGTWRETAAGALVARGLAPEDSERIAQQFVEGVADCLLDVIRKEYEASGRLDGNNLTWTQTTAYANLNRVQSAAVPCVANIGQQAGIPVPANFGTAGSRVDDIAPEPPSPSWASSMEARIRDHVAAYSAPAIEAVLVKCIDEGCNVSLVGRDIRVFDLGFDAFAEQNGFHHAVLRGDGNMRFVWLER
jgi:hypothetical protein